MRTFKKQWLMLAVGLTTGLSIGIVTTALWHSATIDAPRSDLAEHLLHEKMIHAVGSSTGDTLALATGQIHEDAEGVFALDFVTGDLNVRVLNKTTGTFLGAFKRNVLADLEVASDKAPKFVMVTGNASLAGGGVLKPSFCVLYVGDVNSGRVAAYTVPWNKSLAARGVKQTGTLSTVDRFDARVAILQESP